MLVVIVVRVLEGMFVVGAVGCIAVLALTAVEDVRTLLGRDDEATKPEPPRNSSIGSA
jgi:hypothetical protein